MLTYSMTLAPLQSGKNIDRRPSGAIVPTVVGETALCENLRERVAGRLEAVGLPATITSLSATPVAVDSRGNYTYLFTQNMSGVLFLEGRLSADNTFSALNEEFATLNSKVRSAAVCGEFLIFLLADGTLWYLLWNSDTETYYSLGRMPAMPVVSTRRSHEVEHTAAIDAIEFDEVAADLRTDIPDDIVKDVDTEVKKAWQSAVESAHIDGRWTQPVAVRFAVKLWDGRTLYVSQPQIVMPDGGYQGTSRILIPLVSTDAGFTGTQAQTLSVQSFKIEVNTEEWETSGWNNVVRGLEVWVSSPQEAVDVDGSISLSHYTTTSVNYLSAFLPAKSVASLVDMLADTSYYRHSLIPLSSSSTVLSYSSAAEKKIVDLAAISSADLLSLRVGNILGHGDFLHLANVSRSLTAPSVVGAAEDADLEAAVPCIVSVTLAAQSGESRVVAQTMLPAARVAPLLYYPSRDATQIELLMQCDDGVHRAAFPLTPLSTDEDAAVYVSPSLAAIEIPLDATAEFVAPEPLNITRKMPSTVITSMRGNPFVEADRTESAGGEIFTLAPQTSGGGAYTRQFIYLFTSKGIVALTHKSGGEHTNCRIIASEVVNSAARVCPTADGVYAMSNDGNLIRLNDARRSTVFAALPGCKSLAWNRTTNELWLIPYPATHSSSWCRSIVVQISKNFRVWLSSAIPGTLLSADGNPLYLDSSISVAETDGNAVETTSVSGTVYTGVLKSLVMEEAPIGNQFWLSAAFENAKSGLVVGRIGVFGDDVDADVAVETVADGVSSLTLSGGYDAATLDAVHLSGRFVAPAETHFLLGTFGGSTSTTASRSTTGHKRGSQSFANKKGHSEITKLSPIVFSPPSLRFRLSGKIPSLTAITLI